MEHLRKLFFRFSNTTQDRKASRSLLKAAKAGDREQYLALSAKYIDLSQVLFGSSFSEPEAERQQRTERLFVNLWSRLSYAERVSDFEFMLSQDLLKESARPGGILSADTLVTKLRILEPMTRFAFLTYEFEKWPLRWVALVMRLRASELHSILSEARCELCGIGWHSLTSQERSLLQDISVSLDQSPNLRSNKALAEKIKDYPSVAKIKALWLELRPELVEVRHRYIPDQEARETILGQIFLHTESTPMVRPAVMDRVFNTVNFSRHGEGTVSEVSGA